MLQRLSQNHEVTLVSFVRADDDPAAIAHLETHCRAVHTVAIQRSRLADARSLLQSLGDDRPVVILRDRQPAMEELLRTLVQDNPFQAIHADQTSMAQYGLLAARETPPSYSVRTVLDQHNAMHLLITRQATYEPWSSRWLWRREARRFVGYERMLCRRFDRILTVTDEDRQALLGLFPAPERAALAGKFTVLPICVDPSSTEPVQPEDPDPLILHLGTMFWPPNIEGVLWFVREVLPLILAQVPAARFTVAGKNPPKAVRALAGPTVEVTGYVADPRPLLARSQALIVPLLAGGGMRVKILDGWQWGLPLVSTTLGAEGIRYLPEENILLADEPAAFAAAVVRLLTEPRLRKRLRANGRRWVKDHYDWRSTYPAVDALYSHVPN